MKYIYVSAAVLLTMMVPGTVLKADAQQFSDCEAGYGMDVYSADEMGNSDGQAEYSSLESDDEYWYDEYGLSAYTVYGDYDTYNDSPESGWTEDVNSVWSTESWSLPEVSYSGALNAQTDPADTGTLVFDAALQPDFSDETAWANPSNPFNVPELIGQCTWFSWCRFMEIYGMDPGFYGDGYQNASEIVAAHPDCFYLSSVPTAGAVFSSDAAHNHTGIVLSTDETGQNLIIQDGNLDGVSNDYDSALSDYWTRSISLDQLRASYGDVVFANPIE